MITTIDTNISDLLVIKPEIYHDPRGYFFETFNEDNYLKMGIDCHFVQDNESKSSKGVLRGLHFQKGEFAQAKLVRVVKGAVWDVAVDLRKNSTTFGQYYGVELNEQNKLQFFIPRGFAHGFLVLEDNTIFQYKCDNFYNPSAEGGIKWNDKTININWPIEKEDLIISEKDQLLPKFNDLK